MTKQRERLIEATQHLIEQRTEQALYPVREQVPPRAQRELAVRAAVAVRTKAAA